MIKRPLGEKQAQKKLQTVRRQLYGTSDSSQKLVASSQGIVKDRPDSKTVFSFKSSASSAPNYQLQDTNYLKNDLFRIFMFSSLALGAQLLLYLGLSKGLLKF